MRKYLIVFVFTSLFWSCGNVNKAFKNYWRKIPVIKLPLTITCGLCNSDTSINPSIVEKYSFTGAEVIRRLDDKNNVFIIYSYPGDVVTLCLYVYNQQGKMIDSVSLYISSCKKDKYLSYTSWSTIYSFIASHAVIGWPPNRIKPRTHDACSSGPITLRTTTRGNPRSSGTVGVPSTISGGATDIRMKC